MKYPSSILQKILDKFRPLQIFDDGESDQDIRMILAKAMKGIDPAFDWICEIYYDAGSFIYSTYVIMGGSYQGVMKYFRRTYSLSEDGKSAVINDDAVEVRPKQVWETVEGVEDEEEIVATEATTATATTATTATTEPIEIRANCSCRENGQQNREEIEMANLTQSAPNETVGTQAQAPAVASTPPVQAPAATPATQTPASPVLTVQQAIAACPDLRPLVAMAERAQAQEDARKADLVTRLSTAQQVYDLSALQSKPLDELEKIAALVSIDTPRVDFSSRGLVQEPRVNSTPPAIRELPDPWGLEAKGIKLN